MTVDSNDLDELHAALEDLREELQRRRPSPRPRRGREALAAGALSVDWLRLFDQLRRRLNRLGMRERSPEVDDFGMDALALRRALPLLDFLMDRYWRVEVSGLENLPVSGPCLLAANRSGLLPYDGLMIAHAVARWHPTGERPHFLVADWLATLPFAQSTLAQVGGVRACRENAERLLRSGRWVIAFPEGAKGAAKVYRERYRLQRFGRGGIIRTAVTARAPLVPVAVVGAEEVHPVLFRVETPARALGLPFLPVTPTFPALGPLGALPLPTKWRIRFGEPIELAHVGRQGAEDELLVSRMNADLRTRLQALVADQLHRRRSVFR